MKWKNLMIKICQGSIFDSKAEALINPVNCVGVMGAGLALAFKKRYPLNFQFYKDLCDFGALRLGHPLMYFEVNAEKTDYKFIVNFPTKHHWRDKSILESISYGLVMLDNLIHIYDIKEVAMPALGCGLGGLDWGDVKPLIYKQFEEYDYVTIHLYEPKNN